MKKTPFITVIAMLVVVVFIFSGCEMSFNLKKNDDIYETVPVTDESGVTVTDNSGEVVYETVKVTNPVVSVIEVTNKKGEVVATENVTLSKDEVEEGKNFFDLFGAYKDNKKNDTTSEKVNNAKTTAGDKSNKATTAVSDKANGTTSVSIPTGVASDRVTEPAKNDKVQDDLAIINSEKYTIVSRIITSDGAYVYKVARDGNKFSVATSANGTEIGIIVGDDGIYMLSSSTKTYFKIPKALVEDMAGENEEFQGILTGEAFDATRKEKSRSEKTIDGVKYTLVSYEDGSVDYLNGKTLVKTVTEDGNVTYYDTISAEVSAGVFVPPVGYTEQSLTQENVSDFAGDLGITTEHSHKHSDDE